MGSIPTIPILSFIFFASPRALIFDLEGTVMLRMITRRVLAMFPLLFAVALLAFLLAHLAQGDFLSELSSNPQISPETIAVMRRQYGLDQPWYAQFFHWLMGVLRGDFGHSLACNCPVSGLVAERVVNTVTLAMAGLALALVVALPLGVIAPAIRSRLLDRVLSVVSSVILATPSFLLALLAVVMAARTGWFPIGGVRSLDSEKLAGLPGLTDYLHHLVLPATVLALRQSPSYLRQMRAGIAESLSQEYIVTARAKGLSEWRILFKHALGNAINPIVTMFGGSVGSLLSGAFIVETIMSWPGLGSLAVSSLLSRDLNALLACLLLAAALLACGNLLADLLLAATDPRIRRPREARG